MQRFVAMYWNKRRPESGCDVVWRMGWRKKDEVEICVDSVLAGCYAHGRPCKYTNSKRPPGPSPDLALNGPALSGPALSGTMATSFRAVPGHRAWEGAEARPYGCFSGRAGTAARTGRWAASGPTLSVADRRGRRGVSLPTRRRAGRRRRPAAWCW
jgi:hypothetical protein